MPGGGGPRHAGGDVTAEEEGAWVGTKEGEAPAQPLLSPHTRDTLALGTSRYIPVGENNKGRDKKRDKTMNIQRIYRYSFDPFQELEG